jgi:hypothetical protein
VIDTFREPGNGALPNLEAAPIWPCSFKLKKKNEVLGYLNLLLLAQIISKGFLEILCFLKLTLPIAMTYVVLEWSE